MRVSSIPIRYRNPRARQVCQSLVLTSLNKVDSIRLNIFDFKSIRILNAVASQEKSCVGVLQTLHLTYLQINMAY